jgi:hypothetical protein
MKQETSNNIDKIFRDKLYDYQSNPKPESWQKIANKLPQEEELRRLGRRRILYYSIAATTVLTLSVSLFYFIQKENTHMPSSFPNQVYKNSKNDDTVKKQEEKKDIAPLKKTKSPVSSVASITFIEEKTTDGKKEIYLPDGSKVILNRYSKIKYSSNFKKERVVYLYGEVFFDVQPNAQQSFIVWGNFSTTKVFGTSFIIRSYTNEAYDEINVISGKVSFGQTIEKGNEILILAGNKGTIKGDRTEQAPIKDVNYNSWLTEKIVFKNAKLKEVFSVLEQYYNISLKAKNPKILNCEFTGEFEKSDINEILEVLSVSFSLSFNKESKNYILSGKGCR